ncbi:MAG: GNAT family N-acetyltransferase [Candidatus Latescibacterota bacterium]
MAVEISDHVTDEAAGQIRHWLHDLNRQVAGDDGHALLRLCATEGGRLVGGLLGGTFWGYLYVDILVVDEAHRGRGTGTRLLAEAERIARQRGCRHATLHTHDFQALGFYQKKGYAVVGELPDLPPGHVRYELYKRLAPAPDSG